MSASAARPGREHSWPVLAPRDLRLADNLGLAAALPCHRCCSGFVYVIDPAELGGSAINQLARCGFSPRGPARTPARWRAAGSQLLCCSGDPVAPLLPGSPPRSRGGVALGTGKWRPPGGSRDAKVGRHPASPLAGKWLAGWDQRWFPREYPQHRQWAIPIGSMGPYWRRWRRPAWRRGPPHTHPHPAPRRPAGSGTRLAVPGAGERAPGEPAKAA